MKKVIYLISALAFLLLSIWLKCLIVRQQNLNLAKAYLEQNDFQHAIKALGKSIRSRTPFFNSPQAAQLLFEIAQKNSDQLIRRQALLSLKSALISSNQLDLFSLDKIEDQIKSAYSFDAGKELVSENPKPNYNLTFQILADLAFLAWILSAIYGIWRSINSDGTIKKKPALQYSAFWLVLLFTWLELLSFA